MHGILKIISVIKYIAEMEMKRQRKREKKYVWRNGYKWAIIEMAAI